MDRQQALSYYEDFLENQSEKASDKVRKSCEDYKEAFENHICAVQEDMFQQAFRYGYELGLKAAKTTA